MQQLAFKVMMVGLALLLAACSRDASMPAPPKVTTAARIPQMTSSIVLPVSAELSDLEELLNKEVPLTLATIDKPDAKCVPAQKVTACLKHKHPCKGEACATVPCAIGFQKKKLTPDISCHIVGTVIRGPLQLSGAGDMILLRMPVSAEVSAKDIAQVIKSETATAEAEIRARIKLGLKPDWQPDAKVEIDYDWTEKPGIEFLGQRITFAGKADPQVEKLIRKLEADMPRLLARLHARQNFEAGWARAFTSVELNHQNPEVWLRITPQQIGYDGYHVENGRLILRLGVQANTETFVGNRPPDPQPTPLPPLGKVDTASGFNFQIPVVADYQQLVPLLEKALRKLSAKGIEVPGVGRVDAQFGTPTVYTTEGGRIAIGLPIEASAAGASLKSKGDIWLTAQPVNSPGSQRVTVKDLQLAGEAEELAGNLLLKIAEAPIVREEIAGALAQDFARDFGKLRGKIDKALSDRQLGDFRLSARIDTVENGVVTPVGQGLYMPVKATGQSSLRFAPATSKP